MQIKHRPTCKMHRHNCAPILFITKWGVSYYYLSPHPQPKSLATLVGPCADANQAQAHLIRAVKVVAVGCAPAASMRS